MRMLQKVNRNNAIDAVRKLTASYTEVYEAVNL